MDRPFPAYKGDEPYVFVSYSHSDSSAVYPELVWLKESGFNIWYDEGIEAGTEWTDALAGAIRQGKLFLYFLTPDSAQSQNCRNEVNFAVEHNIPLVVVHLKKTELPDGLSLTLSSRQAILKYEIPNEEYQQKLSSRLSTYLGQELIQPIVKTRRRTIPMLVGMVAVVVLAIGLFLSGQLTDKPGEEAAAGQIADINRDTIDNESKQEQNSPPGDTSPTIRRLAILPIRDLSPDGELAWLAGGLREQLSLDIAAWKNIQVVPRVLIREKTGDELAKVADIVIDGYLQSTADGVTVTIEVTDIKNAVSLLSKSLSASASEPMTLQKQISSNLARVFNTVVTYPRNAPKEPRAYEAYLNYLTLPVGAFDQEIYWINRIHEIEPDWIHGWIVLSQEYVNLFWWFGRDEYLVKAEESLLHIPESHPANTGTRLFIDAYGLGKLSAAEEVFFQLASQGNTYNFVFLMINSGMYVEVENAVRQTLSQVPFNPNVWDMLAFILSAKGDEVGFLRAVERLESLDSPDSWQRKSARVGAYMRNGDINRANQVIDELKTRIRLAPDDSLLKNGLHHTLSFSLAYKGILDGNDELVREQAKYYVEQDQYIYAVLFLTMINDPKVHELLDQALQESYWPLLGWGYITANMSPEQREHPAFVQLENHLGITPEWRLYLCQRANELPASTGISCDENKYAIQ